MKLSSFLNPKHINGWLLLVFIAGSALCSIHFFGRSSMWFDELTCALNVQHRTYYQLATQSLDYNQVAPIGFLLLEKFATDVFGENDLAFRFFPWVCSLISLVLFVPIATHFIKGPMAIAAYLLFACSVSHWFYAAEAKQYSGDITASLFLVWSALQLLHEIKKSTVCLVAVFGFVFIVSSLPAVVMAPVLLAIIFVRLLKKQTNISKKHFFIIACCWVAACACGTWYAKFVVDEQVTGDMSAYWNRGFAPLENIGNYFLWMYKTITKELSYFLTAWMKFSVPQITIIANILLLLSIPGIIFLIKKYGLATLILFSPLLIAILLASAKILPFDGRVAIYATWPFIISGIAGIGSLQVWWPFLFRPVAGTVISLVIAIPIAVITIVLPSERPPFNGQSSQPVLRQLKKQMQPGDIVYVYFKARHAMHFYGPKQGVNNYIIGNGHDSIAPFLREVDELKGNKRVWFFFSQWTERQPFPDSIKAYMGNIIGKEIGKIPDPDGNKEDLETAAHLYDLSGFK